MKHKTTKIPPLQKVNRRRDVRNQLTGAFINKLLVKTMLALLFGLVSNTSFAQISMTTTGSNTQNFNALATSGTSNAWTDNSTIANWYSQRTGTGTTYAADAGSGTGGNLYSYGTGTNADRAIGSLGSGNAAAGHFAHGVLLRNTSGSAITDIKVSYTLEQWRKSGVTTAQSITFYYKISSSAITALNPNSNGTWTAVTALNLNSPINTATGTALDGNATANKVSSTSISIPSLNLASNEYIMLKWEDPDHTGADHGLSIDDVTIEWTVGACTNLSALSYTTSSPSPYCTGTAITANNATVTGTTPSYTIDPSLPTGLTISSTTGAITGTPTSASASTVYTITASNSCPSTTTATVTIAVNAPPTALSYSTATASYCNGTLISDNTPSFTGSAATLYAINPNITTNTGLAFNTSTGVISGTPTINSAATTYTVTVTNACSNTTTTISVAVLAPPTALSYSAGTASYCQGTAITNNTPSFTGSTATSYAILPDINTNTGLTFNTTTGVISGTPTTVSASTIYTVTVTNACSNTTTTIDVTVNGQSTVATLTGTATITSGNSTNLQVAITGGSSPYTIVVTDGTTPFTVTGYNSNDNISVSPTVNPTTYSLVSVTSANGCLGTGNTGTAVITVNPAVGSPVINSALTASATYGTLITTTYTITATNSPTSFSATGLPTGLSFNTSTGEITGTPTSVPGNYNVTISATNGSGSGSDVLVYTIGQKTLTVTGATGDNKEYNQTTAATISGSTLVGVIAADNGNVTISNTGTFASANVANGIVITSTQTLGGSAAGNYSLTVPTSLTGNITPKPLTVTGASVTSKAYDGNTTATITGGTLNGVIAPDAVTIVNAGTGTYASAGAANGIAVITTAFSLSGAESGNYSVTQPSLIGNITPVALTVTGITASNKVYDANTTASLNTASAVYVGLVNSESFSVSGTITGTFIPNKNVGTAKTVTITGVDAPSTNYIVTQPTTTADITVAPLTITSPAVTTKAFDGNTNATITGTLSGVLSGDVVTLVGTGTFASSAVGTGISVTSTSTLAGADAGNYEINPQPSGLTGTITAAPVLYNFGTTATQTSAPTSGTPVANLTFGNVSGGNNGGTAVYATLSNSASSGYTGFTGQGNATIGTRGSGFDKDTSTYFTVTITPDAGYQVNLNSLSFGSRQTNTGPQAIVIRTSADNFAADAIAPITVLNNSLWGLKSFTFSTPIQSASGTPLVVRIYGYNGISSATSSANFRIDDLSLNADGTLTPPPTASVLSGTASFCAGSSTNLSVAVTGGASPYTVVVSDGGSNTFTATSASPVSIPVSAAGTYTITSVTDANSGVGTGNSGSAVVTQNASSIPTSVGTYTQTQSQGDGTTLNYIDASCNLIASIQDAAGGNILGSTTIGVELLPSVPSSNTTAYYYSARYYTVTPSSNDAATITLYYSLSDFATYNSGNSYQIDMPTTGSNSDPNISNIKVAHVIGSLSAGTITTYTSPSVNWNSSTSNWEISIPSSSALGSYYLYTPFSCPLNINYATLNATSITAQGVQLNWDAVSGIFDYRVRFRPQGNLNWSVVNSASNSKSINGLQPNTTYEVQVRVRCSLLEQGEYSNTMTFTTLPNPCLPPTGLSYNNVTATSADVSWNTVGIGINYFVQLRVVGNAWGGGSTVTGLSKAFTGLVPGTNYEARVYTNCSGTPSSAYTTSVFFTTTALSCTAPTGLAVGSITNTSAVATWNTVAAGSSYFVQLRKVGDNWGGGSTVTTLTKSYTGLIPGTNYEARVATNCGGVASAVSGSVFFSTTGTVCATPTGLNTTGLTPTGVTLNWTSTGATSYSTRVRVAGTSWGGNSGSVTNSKVITGLTPGTNYEYQIIGICGSLASAWSAIGTFSTGASLMPILFEEESTKAGFVVYPNPTRDQITIEFSTETLQATKVKVMDMTGRVVKMVEAVPQAGEHQYTLSLNELSAGMYTVQVYTNNKLTHISKIQKQD